MIIMIMLQVSFFWVVCISVSLSVSLCLTLCVCVCLSLCSSLCLSLCLCVRLSLSLSVFLCLSVQANIESTISCADKIEREISRWHTKVVSVMTSECEQCNYCKWECALMVFHSNVQSHLPTININTVNMLPILPHRRQAKLNQSSVTIKFAQKNHSEKFL